MRDTMAAGGVGGERAARQRRMARQYSSCFDRIPPAAPPEGNLKPEVLVSVTRTRKAGRWALRPLMSSAILRAQTDERLSSLARDRNQLAFTVLIERYDRELHAHAARIVRSDQADDVVQQAMLRAWIALLAGAEVTEPRAWLHRIAHNAALNMVSKRAYSESEMHDTTAAPTLTEELAEGRMTVAEALAAIAALPARQRQALVLTAIEGRSAGEAANTMGMSENAMRQLIHRARSGVRLAVSALTPLPLISWATNSAGESAAPIGFAVGGAGGIAATAAKVAAVVGVTGAALGGVHAIQSNHPQDAHRFSVTRGDIASLNPARQARPLASHGLVGQAADDDNPAPQDPAHPLDTQTVASSHADTQGPGPATQQSQGDQSGQTSQSNAVANPQNNAQHGHQDAPPVSSGATQEQSGTRGSGQQSGQSTGGQQGGQSAGGQQGA